MPETQESKPLDKMTRPELIVAANERNLAIAADKKATKAQLLDALQADDGAGEPVDVEPVAETERCPTCEGSGSVDGEPCPTCEGAGEIAEGDAVVPAEVADEVGQAIALREHALEPVSALPSPAEFNASMAVAKQIASTMMVPEAYRGRPDDVFAAILFGREIGLGPMQSLRDIYMVDGRPALAAHRQLALLRRGGIVVLETHTTRERAYIRAQRKDTGEVMAVEFTMEEASTIRSKGGKMLVDKDNWRNYPADMLWARAVGRLTRRLGPDLIGGLPPYVAEEVADFSGWGADYGDGNELMVNRPSDARGEHVVRHNDLGWSPPATNAELMKRLETLLGGPEAKEWVTQACGGMYGKLTGADLSVAQRRDFSSRLGVVLYDLDHIEGDLAFDPEQRAKVAAVFAKRMDGLALSGPAWRLASDEEHLPSFDEWQEQRDAEQAEADRIAAESFGDAGSEYGG